MLFLFLPSLFLFESVSFTTPFTSTSILSLGSALLVLTPFAFTLFVVILSFSVSICSTKYVIVYISSFFITGIHKLNLLFLLAIS